jgi:hypothetical protein
LLFLFILNVLVYTKKRYFEKAHSLIHLFIFVTFINEILLRLFALIFKNNVPVINIYGFVEFAIILAFYYNFLSNFKSKILFLSLELIFIILFVYELYSRSIFTPFSFSFLFANFTLVSLACLAFRKIVKNSPTTLITDYSYFWINSGILIYYSCTLFVFGLERYLVKYELLNEVLFYILNFFIFIYYSLLSIGLWKTSKK